LNLVCHADQRSWRDWPRYIASYNGPYHHRYLAGRVPEFGCIRSPRPDIDDDTDRLGPDPVSPLHDRYEARRFAKHLITDRPILGAKSFGVVAWWRCNKRRMRTYVRAEITDPPQMRATALQRIGPKLTSSGPPAIDVYAVRTRGVRDSRQARSIARCVAARRRSPAPGPRPERVQILLCA
jgi:hypothetical protein